MGRYSTGAASTEASKKVSISMLIKAGYLKPGCKIDGIVNFTLRGEGTGSISISTNTIDEPNLQLAYSVQDKITGRQSNIDYTVKLIKIPSNLGKGFRYYFLCPFTYKKCTILYMAYGSHYFKHREAFNTRLYYPCQLESKKSLCYRYHSIQKQIDTLSDRIGKSHYRGLNTHLINRIEYLESRHEYYSGKANQLLIAWGKRKGLFAL